MKMLERAARAMAYDWFLNDFEPEEAMKCVDRDWVDFESGARAALLAIREPDEVMIRAGCAAIEAADCPTLDETRDGLQMWECSARDAHHAMIDAILSEDKQ